MFPTKEIVHGQVNRLVGLLAGRAVSDSLEYGFGVVARGIYQIPWYNGPVMHSHLIAEQWVTINSEDENEDTFFNRLSLIDSAATSSDNAALSVTAEGIDHMYVIAYGENSILITVQYRHCKKLLVLLIG